MLTRYQRKANLYSKVLEEPNIMSTIIQHLEPEDVVMLLQSKGDFTREPRFKDTVALYLKHRRRLYEERVQKRYWKDRMCVFNQTMRRVQREFNHNYNLSRLDEMFECIRDNMDVLAHFECFELMEMTEKKLVEFVHHDEYGLNALRFLGEIFDIHVQARGIPGAEDEYVEFIEDRNGNVLWL